MLVLSRKRNESLLLNHDVVVTVVEIRGDKVRLGVEAPKEIPVHRKEVYDAIQRERGGVVAPIMLSLPPEVRKAVEKLAGERGQDVDTFLVEWVSSGVQASGV